MIGDKWNQEKIISRVKIGAERFYDNFEYMISIL